LAAKGPCRRCVSYPRPMPDIPQLVAAIESRLADIAAEISALEAAARERVKAAPDVGSPVTAQRSRRKPAATVTRPRSGGAVGVERLEPLLADTPEGLSANTIAQRAGAGYNRTLKLLRELEAAGHVRRSGSRRSTVWRLITDEERIAERAAELERLRRAPSQRRGRPRAS
jgi:hypothetical protein